ncbi:MAG: hypothetical protein HOI53_03240 [Francisellaceae bacterium]|nr:hypothetical protein [Francisellaceae bacterium]MBT6207017.1 hypothetical protein [Francisellaceae bacterium]MBT6538626.1 hypothetical protein [Francisellaceae bacterium]
MVDVSELTISYFEDDKEVVKELDKEILSKGAWATILYKYIEWDKRKEDYGDDKYSIRRYQKRDGEYKQKSKFNISSKAQAEKIIETLTKWVAEETVED